MIIRSKTDSRFVEVTNVKINGLFRKVPKQFGGWKIDIMYREDDNKIGAIRQSVDIDQSKFDKEILEFWTGKRERLHYTDGMCDVDIFKRGDHYLIYQNPNDGLYTYFQFSKKEFEKLITWIKLENK